MVNGYCDENFIEARHIFEKSISSGFELGGSIAVEVKGKKAVSYTHLTLPTKA